MLYGLFEFALKREWCDRNPVKLVGRRKVMEKEISPLSCAQTKDLLKNAKAAFDAAGLDIAYYRVGLVYTGGEKYENDIYLGPLTAAEVAALP